jgi:hypothetical protein
MAIFDIFTIACQPHHLTITYEFPEVNLLDPSRPSLFDILWCLSRQQTCVIFERTNQVRSSIFSTTAKSQQLFEV